jgi:hypothetical protein
MGNHAKFIFSSHFLSKDFLIQVPFNAGPPEFGTWPLLLVDSGGLFS